jgi:hypothetical protein
MLEYRERSLRTDIAAHARGRKKVPNETATTKFLSIRFGVTEQRIMRFSPAMDVLPFCRLSTSPDQVRLSNVPKNNRRGRQAA